MISPTPEQIRERLHGYAYKALMLASMGSGPVRNALLKFSEGFKQALSLLDRRDAEIAQLKGETERDGCGKHPGVANGTMCGECQLERAEQAEASLLRMTEERDRLELDVRTTRRELDAAGVERFSDDDEMPSGVELSNMERVARLNQKKRSAQDDAQENWQSVKRLTGAHEQIKGLSAQWRQAAAMALALVKKFDQEGDDAGNRFAFLKERRIWTTCADDLDTLLAPPEEKNDER